MTDDQVLRQRLHEEFGALEISPPPVLRVTGRGRGVRARRRALAACTVVLAALAIVAAARFHHQARIGPTVTLNAPNPAAPGGVFASGTAHGKPWALAVRNIAAAPGTHWCRAAVMFNGRDGGVLFKTGRGTPSFGNPALLSHIRGFPRVGVVFTQVAPGTTRLALTFPGGRQISATPVQVRACGTSFNLAGLAFDSRHIPSEIATYTRFGLDEGLDVNFAMATSVFERTTPGIWMNLDNSRADIAASQAGSPIGTGTVNGQTWHMWASLGLYGQCYTAAGRVPGHGRGQGSVCVPVTMPPRTAALTAVTVYSAQTQLPGYAGLVNPRTAYVYATVSDGTTHQVVPVRVAGRAYIALVAPPGCQLSSLSLFDASGHPFASVVNPAQSAQPIPGLPQPAGSS
jgi:hypothetical protein